MSSNRADVTVEANVGDTKRELREAADIITSLRERLDAANIPFSKFLGQIGELDLQGLRGFEHRLDSALGKLKEMGRITPGIMRELSAPPPPPPASAPPVRGSDIVRGPDGRGGQSNNAMLAKFNASARDLLDDIPARSARAAAGLEAAGVKATKLRGLLQTAASATGSSGGLMGEISSIAGLAVTLGPIAAALAAVGLITNKVTGDILKSAEAALKLQEKLAAVKTIGLAGGGSSAAGELKKLNEVQREVDILVERGEHGTADALIREVLGTGATLTVLETRRKQVEERVRSLQAIAYQRGESNIFSDAEKKLGTEQGGYGPQLARQLGELRHEYLAGTLSIGDYDRAVEKLSESFKSSAATSAEAAKLHEDFTSKAKERAKLLLDARAEIQGLEQSLSDNPFDKLFTEGARALGAFREKYKDLGGGMVADMTSASARILALGIFKEELAGRGRVGDLALRAEQARQTQLDAYTANETERAAILAELTSRRAAGTLSGQEQLALLAKMRAVGGSPSTNVDRKAIELAEQAIRDTQERMRKFDAATPEGRQAELAAGDFVLAALGRIDPAKLPPSLLDAQLKILERRMEVETSALKDALDRQVNQNEVMTKLLASVDNLSSVVNSATIIELRDRSALGTFTIERLGAAARPVSPPVGSAPSAAPAGSFDNYGNGLTYIP